MAFCAWLSERMAQEIRLPTQWEWQYAVAGTGAEPYPWGSDADEQGGYANTGGLIGHPTAVGLYPNGRARKHAVYDLVGNCREWCCNLFDEDTEPRSPQDCEEHPRGATEEIEPARSMVGGSWRRPLADGSVGHVQGASPFIQDLDFGFRVVKYPVG
jgi:formylglycine-generating enzyme required for sulfatase activity